MAILVLLCVYCCKHKVHNFVEVLDELYVRYFVSDADRNGDSRLNKSAIFFSDCEALRFLLRSYRQLLLIVVRLGR